MKPICVNCQRFYRPKKNGVFFIESMPTVSGAPAGKTAPESWKPYKLWSVIFGNVMGADTRLSLASDASP